MKKARNEKGVTLVALVVTIIVLIILAGISINLLLGENGLITIAKRAKENTELAQIEEGKQLNQLYSKITEENNSSINYDAIAKLTEFKKQIASAITEKGIETREDDTLETMINNIKNISTKEEIADTYVLTALSGTHSYISYHDITSANGITYNGKNISLEKGKYLYICDVGSFGYGIATSNSSATNSNPSNNTEASYEVFKTIYSDTTNKIYIQIIKVEETMECKFYTNGYSGGRTLNGMLLLMKL